MQKDTQQKPTAILAETVHSLIQSTALCEMLQIDIAQDQTKATAKENARRYEVADILKQKIQATIDALEKYQLQVVK